MRSFMIACALVVGLVFVGCGKSPHDPIWAKATSGFEEINVALKEFGSNPSMPACSAKLRIASQKLKEAASELAALNLTQQQKLRAEAPYSARLGAAMGAIGKFEPSEAAISSSPRDVPEFLSALSGSDEASLSWNEATGYLPPAEIAAQRAKVSKQKADIAVLTAQIQAAFPAGSPPAGAPGALPGGIPGSIPGGAPGATPGGAGYGLPPGGPGGAPGAVPGGAGYGLPPGGPGGASAAPATGAPSGFGLPPTGPGGGTAPVGATATIPPGYGGTPGASTGVPPGYGLPGASSAAPTSTGPMPGGAGYGLPPTTSSAPTATGPIPGGPGYGLPPTGSNPTAPTGVGGPVPGGPGYGLPPTGSNPTAPTSVGPIPGGPGYGLPPGGPSAPTGTSLPPTGSSLPPGATGASIPGGASPGIPGQGGSGPNLSIIQQKAKEIVSPDHQGIIRDLLSCSMDVVTSLQQANNKKGALAAKGQATRASEKIRALAKKLDKLPPLSESEASAFHHVYDELVDSVNSTINNSTQQVKSQYPPLTTTLNPIGTEMKKAFDVMTTAVNAAEKRAINAGDKAADEAKKDKAEAAADEGFGN